MAQSPISLIIDFAGQVELSSPKLVSDLRTKISFFPVESLPIEHRSTFEKKGIDLWNRATRHSRGLDEKTASLHDEVTKVALLHVFAFGMLDSVALSSIRKKKREETCVRILNVAFKCIKDCIEAEELGFASKVASRAADWLDNGESVLNAELGRQFSGEYFVCRVALVSLQIFGLD